MNFAFEHLPGAEGIPHADLSHEAAISPIAVDLVLEATPADAGL